MVSGRVGYFENFKFLPILLNCFSFLVIVDTSGGKLSTKMLETKNVYILDCHTEIFVW